MVKKELLTSVSIANDEHELWILQPGQGQRGPQSTDSNKAPAYRHEDQLSADGARAEVGDI